jgi:DNA repair protein SbcD/Mre11
MIKFIHCADLHIDSPFKGVSDINPELADLLYKATYDSFSNIVALALEEKVDAVLIAGDIYDSEDKSLRAQFRFRDGLKKLSDAGIASFIVHGNHDPLSGWAATIGWPENVWVFPAEPACLPLVKDGVKIANIYGVSYPRREIKENLAARFPEADRSLPCIALLHANVGSNTDHADYAPCSIDDLNAARMDYWALGHVHTHKIMGSLRNPIVYPGCSQGRNPRETGKKGCCLVTLPGRADPEVKFIQTDVFRHFSVSLDISKLESIELVESAVVEAGRRNAAATDGCNCIFRVELTGRTDVNQELRHNKAIGDLLDQIRMDMAGDRPVAWLDKLILNTASAYDVDSLRGGKDIIADIITACDEMIDPANADSGELRTSIKTLFNDNKMVADIMGEIPDDTVRELAVQARNLALDDIIGSD